MSLVLQYAVGMLQEVAAVVPFLASNSNRTNCVTAVNGGTSRSLA
ncbi:MAG: hypothetical protein ABSH39_19305 [Candidatus Acidiferrum sp.]|jgi:hypothetical protein